MSETKINTTENIKLNPPTGAATTAAKKEWDDMSPEEQNAERARAQAELRTANTPDVTKDREIDKVLKRMEQVFADQKRHSIVLFQISGAMKSAGHKDLPAQALGINGYNFVIPRGVPVNLPEDAIHILYQSGEVNPQTMIALGLLTPEQVSEDLRQQGLVAEQIANKIRPMDM